MSEVKTNGSKPAGQSESAAEAAALIVDNLHKGMEALQHQVVASVALSSIIACLPGTADIDAQELGAVIAAITRGRGDAPELRDKAAVYAARLVGLARDARDEAAKVAAKKAEIVAGKN
jgi:hypothetical protein